jgi:hypothetical protein
MQKFKKILATRKKKSKYEKETNEFDDNAQTNTPISIEKQIEIYDKIYQINDGLLKNVDIKASIVLAFSGILLIAMIDKYLQNNSLILLSFNVIITFNIILLFVAIFPMIHKPDKDGCILFNSIYKYGLIGEDIGLTEIDLDRIVKSYKNVIMDLVKFLNFKGNLLRIVFIIYLFGFISIGSYYLYSK